MASQTAYFDRRGRHISRAVWAHLCDDSAYAYVCCDAVRVGGRVADVHTFWVGVAGRTAAGPLLFRTVLDRQHMPDLVWGWPSEAAARTGHGAVCAWLAARGPLPAGLLRDGHGAQRAIRTLDARARKQGPHSDDLGPLRAVDNDVVSTERVAGTMIALPTPRTARAGINWSALPT